MPININFRKQNNLKKFFYPLTLIIILIIIIAVLILVINFLSTVNSDAFTIDQSLTKSEVIELRKYDFNITAIKLGVMPPLDITPNIPQLLQTSTIDSIIESSTQILSTSTTPTTPITPTTTPTSTISTSTTSTSTKKKN